MCIFFFLIKNHLYWWQMYPSTHGIYNKGVIKLKIGIKESTCLEALIVEGT